MLILVYTLSHYTIKVPLDKSGLGIWCHISTLISQTRRRCVQYQTHVCLHIPHYYITILLVTSQRKLKRNYATVYNGPNLRKGNEMERESRQTSKLE